MVAHFLLIKFYFLPSTYRNSLRMIFILSYLAFSLIWPAILLILSHSICQLSVNIVKFSFLIMDPKYFSCIFQIINKSIFFVPIFIETLSLLTYSIDDILSIIVSNHISIHIFISIEIIHWYIAGIILHNSSALFFFFLRKSFFNVFRWNISIFQ